MNSTLHPHRSPSLARRWVAGAALALLALSAASAPVVRAAAVSGSLLDRPASSSLSLDTLSIVSDSAVVRGSAAVVYELQAPVAGRFSISLADLAFPDPLATLSFSLTSSTAVLQTLDGPGEASFAVGTPGAYFGNVFHRTGTRGIGAYALNITFTPDGATLVPLPTSLWLLLLAAAGLAGLLHVRVGPVPDLDLAPGLATA